MQVSVIDLGSNSIRLVIYKWNGKKLVKVQDVKRQAKSMKYIHHNEMNHDGVENIISTLKELILISKSFDTNDIRIFATAAIRNIENSIVVRKMIEGEIHLKIDVLDGVEESLLGFEGAKQVVELPEEGISVDIGGGSTEITYFKNQKPVFSDSIPIGSLNMYLNFVDNVLPTKGEQFLMQLEIRNHLDHIEWLSNIKINTIIGIGGSSRAIFKLHKTKYDLDESIYNIVLNHDSVKSYANIDQDNFNDYTKLIINATPERLTTIVPGALILNEIFHRTQASQFILSAFGVREGYVFNRVIKEVD
jgi:exopolyphosphatase / guanosine-5'-triphosphate,3'-diphosphate pyrophosphatase